jgi:PAS domain S-box-containing protein
MTDDDGLYKSLIETTLAIPWKIDWESKRFVYIGPQIQSLLGWSKEDWRTVDDWVKKIHPGDRQFIVDFCVSQVLAGLDHEATYRALKANGTYLWIRDVVHVIRNKDNQPEALQGFMFNAQHCTLTSPVKHTGILAEMYELTVSEQNITNYLSEGLSQKEIAFKLGIKHGTIRKNLQSIYRKTSTSNQSQLIKLLLTLPATKVDYLNR